MKDLPTAMRSGEVARAAGVNQQTLRYYERRGLLPQPDRSSGGHRLYSTEVVTTLRVIKAAQRLGFSLDEVAGLLEMGRHYHSHARGGLQTQARTKLAEVDQRIADLRVIRSSLLTALEAGCDDLIACAESECCPLPFTGLASVTIQ